MARFGLSSAGFTGHRQTVRQQGVEPGGGFSERSS
jgi:hypothetical protein